MIHDKARVERIRANMKGQLELIKTLGSKIAKGKLDPLRVARLQTEDVETLYLRDLNQKDRSPAEEAQWLSFAEHNLQTWGPYLKEVEEQFRKHGDHGIEVVGQ